MSAQHIPYLRRIQDNPESKIHTLSEFAIRTAGEDVVPDPYGNTLTAYRSCARLLLDY